MLKAKLKAVCGLVAAIAVCCSCQTGKSPIVSVTKSASHVGKYEKFELTVGAAQTFSNAYDPDEVDLGADFSSPTGQVRKVNGFYDGAQWKIRFAANETGKWTYVVHLKDKSGETLSNPGQFTCDPSTNHGWVRVAANDRYLTRDDGTSFYGVGACYPWNNTTNGFDRMRDLGMNIYVYWNGTYDRDGGNNLVESTNSGIGRYDQRKCARIDRLIEWSEQRGLGMVLVIWPHDYLSEGMRGWPAGWSRNPYKTITTSRNFYGDTNAWAYQEKLYRYIIARWSYSTSLAAWQTIDEISGTSGWSNRPVANAWAGKIASYFQENDPFRHPTTASHGDFWDEGNKANDLPNTEVYRNYSESNLVSTVGRLWTNYEKPCIMGETGANRSARNTRRALWAGLSSGMAVTPLFWSFNQGWNNSASSQFAPFEKFIENINFAGLTGLAQANVSVPGAGAHGITSDQLTFGWVTGDLAGKTFSINGLKDDDYRLEWWDCATGAVLSSNRVTVAGGGFTVDLPVHAVDLSTNTNSAPVPGDLAFKIVK